MKAKLLAKDALLIVDPQLDFMPGGALSVANGDKIIPIVNQWIEVAVKLGLPVIVSRDWHPANHCSFKEQGGIWPVHCVQDTKGAQFHPELALPKDVIIIDKATDPDKETYSAFGGETHDDHTPLPRKLQQLGVKRVWIAGLATDYCVYQTALGAHQHGFDFHVILPACRAITKDTEAKALKDMQAHQAVLETNASPYVKD